MCSIFGAYSSSGFIDDLVMQTIREEAMDRGRDGGRLEYFDLKYGGRAALGNWRATPTTELDTANLQPYNGIVHNGTIANDRELGNDTGDVDSTILDRVIDRSSVEAFATSLERIIGSYALATVSSTSVLLAANYKPLHYIEHLGVVYFSSMERHLEGIAGWGRRPARLAPYTALDLQSQIVAPLPRLDNDRALVICSGGLDSVTVAYMLRDDGFDVELLHFTYGCHAEAQEVDRVEKIARDLGVPLHVLPLDYSQFKGSSALLNESEIATGIAGAEFAHEWVPARNLVMIAHAVAFAEAHDIAHVALGNNLEESGAYPDNEEEFTNLLDQALDYAVHDGGKVRLISPVGHFMKHEIVRLGTNASVPYGLTWSCYRNGEHHCGRCGPCFMRRTAFARNQIPDPTTYED